MHTQKNRMYQLTDKKSGSVCSALGIQNREKEFSAHLCLKGHLGF